LLTYFFLFTKFSYGIPKQGGEFYLQDFSYYIEHEARSILLLDSKNVKHRTIANSGFFQIGVAFLMKKSILDTFEKLAKQMENIRRAKDKKNKHLYDQIIENLKIKKIKK